MERSAGDFELLRRYAQQRDEAAFAELVGRHVNLVFSAALRRTRDRHLAEDVTQAVFVVLAKKASRVGGGKGSMSAWLLKCAKYASANAIKMQARRQKHEEAARFATAAMGGAGACSPNPTDVLIWQEIAGQLDDAVLRLPSLDRQTVLLRYFEGFTIEQIARALNVTEGAARQRLSRAVDTLRQRLSRHNGAMMSQLDAAALAALLISHAVQTAPAGLGAATIATATGAATSAGGVLIAKGAMTMMAWTQTKLVAAMMAVVVIGGAGGIVAMKKATAAPNPVTLAAEPQNDNEASRAKAGSDQIAAEQAEQIKSDSFEQKVDAGKTVHLAKVLDAGMNLRVSNPVGIIEVTNGPGKSLQINGVNQGRDAAKIRVDTSGQTVSVSVDYSEPRSSRAEVRLNVQIPNDLLLNLTAKEASGDSIVTRLANHDREIQVQSASGRVVLKESSGKHLIAKSVSGDTVAERTDGDLDAGSVSGSVSVSSHKGDVHAHSVSGDVKVTMTTGHIDAKSVSGSVHLNNPQATSEQAQSVSGHVQKTER